MACAPEAPSQAQAKAALQDYFATPHSGGVDVAGGELRDASLISFADCSAMGATFTCQVQFDHQGRRVSARMMIVKRGQTWFVESLRPL